MQVFTGVHSAAFEAVVLVKLTPATHAVQTRSRPADGITLWNVPGPQLAAQGTHAVELMVLLKVPLAHTVHFVLVLEVPGPVTVVPGGQSFHLSHFAAFSTEV